MASLGGVILQPKVFWKYIFHSINYVIFFVFFTKRILCSIHIEGLMQISFNLENYLCSHSKWTIWMQFAITFLLCDCKVNSILFQFALILFFWMQSKVSFHWDLVYAQIYVLSYNRKTVFTCSNMHIGCNSKERANWMFLHVNKIFTWVNSFAANFLTILFCQCHIYLDCKGHNGR